MAKKRTRRSTTARGRNSAQAQALHRTFGDLEVVDADTDLRVPITDVDIRRGEKKNPEECAISQACKRELHSSAAVIYKVYAYVDVLGEDGVRRVERFMLSPASRALVEAFDSGKPVPADGRWLVLKAPPPSHRLDAKLQTNRRRRSAIKKGTYVPSEAEHESTRAKPRDLGIRNGQGHWQMIRAQAAKGA